MPLVRATLAQDEPEGETPGEDTPEGSERFLGLPVSSAEDIMASETTVSWVLKPFLAKGCITEMLGEGKTSGKTTLISELVKPVLGIGRFLGESSPSPGAVLWLTEEYFATFRLTLCRSFRTGEAPGLWILPWFKVADMSWTDLASVVQEVIPLEDLKLVIIDTLPQFTLETGDVENDAGSAYKALRPIQRMLEGGAAVLVVRHTPKQAPGKAAKAGRGSSAFSAAVDQIVYLREVKGAECQRDVKFKGRFGNLVPKSLRIEYDPDAGGYVEISREGGGEVLLTQDDVLRLLEGCPEGLSVVDMHARMGGVFSRATVQRRLTEMTNMSILEMSGKGVKGDPKLWRKVL